MYADHFVVEMMKRFVMCAGSTTERLRGPTLSVSRAIAERARMRTLRLHSDYKEQARAPQAPGIPFLPSSSVFQTRL